MKIRENERRDSLLLVLALLLLGFICIFLTSGWALRFAPNWRLDSNMGSSLNPDDGLLTSRPSGFFEPIDPSILNDPAWLGVFLTPGASFATRTPLPTVTAINVPQETNTTVPTPILVATNTLITVASPTNTQIFFPPPTSTAKPKPTATPQPPATNTPIPPIPAADLVVTKTDGVTTYTAGGTLTYTIAVSNNGTSGVTGAVVTDNLPAQIASWSWACTSQNGGATGCDAVAGSSASFSDTVNLPSGASIVYTVTANISASATGNLANTASINLPAGYTDPSPGNNSATDTDTFVPPSADLQITKTDNATDYAANSSVQYSIVASNLLGPTNVVGATVTDNFSANLTGVTWTCSGSGGASCTAAGAGNINDTVSLPVGGSVQYTVNATVVASPSGPLVNTATISVPAGITDTNSGNNSATDTDQLIIASSFPYGNIGTTPDGVAENISSGTFVVLQFGTPLVVGSGQSLVYYLPPSLQVDAVILQVGDGSNWYTVFNWGNGAADGNTDVSVPLPVPPNPTDCAGEPDQCVIDSSLLTNSPGISINVNALPPGSYPYIRIISPANPPDTGNNGVNVDAITVLP